MVKSNLNSIEEIIFQPLTDTDISHEKTLLVCNDGGKYYRLNENMKNKNSKRGDIERGTLIEHGERIGTHVIIKYNERIRNDLKSQV